MSRIGNTIAQKSVVRSRKNIFRFARTQSGNPFFILGPASP